MAPTAGSEPSILAHWSDPELARAGFDDDAVRRLRRATPDTLLDVWPELADDEALFDKIWECAEETGDDLRVRVPPDQSRSGQVGTESCGRRGNAGFEA